MTRLVRTEMRTTPTGEPCFQISLQAQRANALEPGLLTALAEAFDELDRSGARLVLLTGGRNFSSGGDVSRFHAAAEEGRAAAYASEVVPLLQALVLRMIKTPAIFAVAARGAITGGAAGFLFASDLAVLAPEAFVQPYYTQVGFAPDGGWTAILPDRIGAGLAASWLHTDRRRDAREIVDLGLAAEVEPNPEARAYELLAGTNVDAALAVKVLLWDGARCAAVRQRLDAETNAFKQRISLPETRIGMARFLGRAVANQDA